MVLAGVDCSGSREPRRTLSLNRCVLEGLFGTSGFVMIRRAACATVEAHARFLTTCSLSIEFPRFQVPVFFIQRAGRSALRGCRCRCRFDHRAEDEQFRPLKAIESTACDDFAEKLLYFPACRPELPQFVSRCS